MHWRNFCLIARKYDIRRKEFQFFSDFELTGPCIDFCLENRAECKVECSLKFYSISRSALNYKLSRFRYRR